MYIRHFFFVAILLGLGNAAFGQTQPNANFDAIRWLGWTVQAEQDCRMHGDNFVNNTKNKVLGLKAQMDVSAFSIAYNTGKELAISQEKDENTGGVGRLCNVLNKSGHFQRLNYDAQPMPSTASRTNAVANQTGAAANDDISGWTIVLWIYVLIAGFITWSTVRRPLINWYRSSVWLVSGKGPIDILLKQVGYRLTFELFIFGLACAFGAFGGWLKIFIKKSSLLPDVPTDRAA